MHFAREQEGNGKQLKGQPALDSESSDCVTECVINATDHDIIIGFISRLQLEPEIYSIINRKLTTFG